MKVIVSGGGTGGHIYPALAIARGILNRVPDTNIIYVGTRNGLESKVVPKAGFEFYSIDITGLDRSSLLKASTALVKFPKSVFQAWNIIKNFKPDIVIGTGGYVSFPVVYAATLFPGCKTYIHEQNAYPGIANRNLAKRVNCTMLTFPEAARYINAKKIKITGLPVREEILGVNKEESIERLRLDASLFTILIFGGSRGAARINKAMLEMLQEYSLADTQFIWIVGDSSFAEIQDKIIPEIKNNKKVMIKSYMHDIEYAMAAADLAVCRAGASTLSELAILGLPAILIPYPYASENHQEKNARALAEKKAVEMVIDEFLDGETLYRKIIELKDDRDRLYKMKQNIKKEARTDALEKILDIILE